MIQQPLGSISHEVSTPHTCMFHDSMKHIFKYTDSRNVIELRGCSEAANIATIFMCVSGNSL